jgi:hypothetical protein
MVNQEMLAYQQALHSQQAPENQQANSNQQALNQQAFDNQQALNSQQALQNQQVVNQVGFSQQQLAYQEALRNQQIFNQQALDHQQALHNQQTLHNQQVPENQQIVSVDLRVQSQSNQMQSVNPLFPGPGLSAGPTHTLAPSTSDSQATQMPAPDTASNGKTLVSPPVSPVQSTDRAAFDREYQKALRIAQSQQNFPMGGQPNYQGPTGQQVAPNQYQVPQREVYEPPIEANKTKRSAVDDVEALRQSEVLREVRGESTQQPPGATGINTVNAAPLPRHGRNEADMERQARIARVIRERNRRGGEAASPVHPQTLMKETDSSAQNKKKTLSKEGDNNVPQFLDPQTGKMIVGPSMFQPYTKHERLY